MSLGSNQREWGKNKDVTFVEVGRRAGVDKSVAESAVREMWSTFGSRACSGERQELLLSCGKLTAEGKKYWFIPKPIHAETVPGRDCLRLPSGAKPIPNKSEREGIGGRSDYGDQKQSSAPPLVCVGSATEARRKTADYPPTALQQEEQSAVKPAIMKRAATGQSGQTRRQETVSLSRGGTREEKQLTRSQSSSCLPVKLTRDLETSSQWPKENKVSSPRPSLLLPLSLILFLPLSAFFP